jgi:hypothetical protein
VEVALHPRMRKDLQSSGIFPEEWSWSLEASTYARMSAPDVRVVIQSQSGVGLEALHLGLPVINLVAPYMPNHYYYMNCNFVRRASNSSELALALRNLEEVDNQSVERHEYGLSWIGLTGEAAAVAIGETILGTLKEELPMGLALNGWGTDPLTN